MSCIKQSWIRALASLVLYQVTAIDYFQNNRAFNNLQQNWLTFARYVENEHEARAASNRESQGAIFLWGRGEVEWNRAPCYRGQYWPIGPAPDDGGWLVWSSRWNAWQGKLKYSEKTRPSSALSSINVTWPDLGSNTGSRSGKQLTRHLSYGTATREGPLNPQL
jgi:hypothetical protein